MWKFIWKSMISVRFSKGSGGGENPGAQNLSLGWPSVWRAKVMLFHRFSIGLGGSEIRSR